MLEKLFVEYPGLRSSTSDYDPCTERRNGAQLDCRKCKVFLATDRFLGQQTHEKIMGNSRSFPYIIIVDTAGCNLRCWFCYSHHYWAPDPRTKPEFLTTDEVVAQIECKIEQISKFQRKRRPLTRIRISGGEPIFADRNVIRPYSSNKRIDYELGIKYWLEFFEKLDVLIGKLKSQGKICIYDEKNWNYQEWNFRNRKNPWPVFVSDVPDRVRIRFDTNGTAFGDSTNPEVGRVEGDAQYARKFIDGIYDLYSKGRLNNIKIWITYSLKGATPVEYYWSQKRGLGQSNSKNFTPNDHPQYSGYYNLLNEINKFGPDFRKNCVDITAEKGVEHDTKHNVYLYSEDALDWDIFSGITGIALSQVANTINLIYQFEGEWGLRQKTEPLIKRYLKQGAIIEIYENNNCVFSSAQISDIKSAAKQAIDIIDKNKDNQNFKIILKV